MKSNVLRNNLSFILQNNKNILKGSIETKALMFILGLTMLLQLGMFLKVLLALPDLLR